MGASVKAPLISSPYCARASGEVKSWPTEARDSAVLPSIMAVPVAAFSAVPWRILRSVPDNWALASVAVRSPAKTLGASSLASCAAVLPMMPWMGPLSRCPEMVLIAVAARPYAVLRSGSGGRPARLRSSSFCPISIGASANAVAPAPVSAPTVPSPIASRPAPPTAVAASSGAARAKPAPAAAPAAIGAPKRPAILPALCA